VTEHLVIVGRLGWHYDDLLARINAPELRGRVHLAGYVAPADLPSVYQEGRLFIYPSIEEGFGFPPLEVMACGVPTISSTQSALEERVLRLCGCGVLPLHVAGVRFGQIWPKRPLRRKLLMSLPWLAGLCVAHACGEFFGYLTGVGSSPAGLR
jgi:glycosyltransferase involved in cell wall biosynthesis